MVWVTSLTRLFCDFANFCDLGLNSVIKIKLDCSQWGKI